MFSTHQQPASSARCERRRLAARFAAAALALLLGVASGCGGDIESRMTEVRALQDVGQFDASIDELQEILAIDPDLAEANYRLGLAQVQMGEPSRAIWALQKAAESSEYQIPAGVLLASTHQQTKNYDEAVRAATRVLEADPDREAALRIRAMAQLGARRLDAALEDSRRLVGRYPDDYSARLLHATVLADAGRMEEAEREHELVKKLGAESGNPELSVRACLTMAVFVNELRKESDRARKIYAECAEQLAELRPPDVTLVDHLVRFYDSVKEPERATQIVRTAAESAPENLGLRRMLANRQRQQGDLDGAEKTLLDSVDSFGSAPAYEALAEFYRTRKQPEKALAAIEKVIEISGGNDSLRFTQADVLIDLEDLDQARNVASQIKQPAYQQLILGRIALVSGDPKSALASFEKGIQAWPNNAAARLLAGLAARDLGDEERAIAELRESARVSAEETDAALELARILYQRGEYREAILFANMALRGPGGPRRADPYVVAVRAMVDAGQIPRARGSIDALRQLGHAAIAARELALLERSQSGPEASQKALESSELDLADPANLEVLQQSVENLTLLGRTRDALAAIDAASARNPESAPLYELRGLTLARSGDAAGGRQAFEKALALDARSAASLAGLGTLSGQAGDFDAAIGFFERADALPPSDGSYAHAAAQLALAAGKRQDAISRLRQIVQRHPNQAGARNDLAYMLAEDGVELDFALSLAQEAQRRSPTPEVLDTLGFVYLKRGEPKQAVAALEQALAALEASGGARSSASIRYHLGSALEKAGDVERARENLKAALAEGDFPQAAEARAELARLDK